MLALSQLPSIEWGKTATYFQTYLITDVQTLFLPQLKVCLQLSHAYALAANIEPAVLAAIEHAKGNVDDGLCNSEGSRDSQNYLI